VPADADNPMPTLDAPFMVRPGDVLKVEFLYHPELNVTQTVRPDGKISLRLVNEVDVAGLGPEEVRRRLLEGYSTRLKDPEITLIIQAEQRFVYVGGEVAIPGGQFPIRVPVVGRLTPMEAIMQAGGLRNASAKLSNVLIIRRIGEKQYARTIDLRAAFRSGECEPFFLEPDDIVFVPRTKIDRANQWVAQYMNRLVPDWIRVNLGYSYVQSEAAGAYSTITTSPTGVTVSRTIPE
jgi:polysaccharide export outer membrane protein